MLVDSHCHLNFPEFKDDLDDVIKRAMDNQVTTLLTVNTRLNQAKDLQEIADRYPHVWCSVGTHPHDSQNVEEENLFEQILTLVQHPKVIAIGETGLDYYYNNSPKEAQINSFQTHIKAAVQLDLPLIIHTRDADEDTIDCLINKNAKGVFHCFSGGLEIAKKALDLGFYLSFSGIITFKKAEELREVAKFVPLDRVLVETDSPFLAPIPHRGSRNEPAFTRYTATLLAELRGASLEEIAIATTNNFYTLFDRCQKQ